MNLKDHDKLEAFLEGWSPQDLAMLLQDLEPADQVMIFSAIDREQAYETFELLDLNDQVVLIGVLRNRQLQLILNDMSADNRTALLEQLETDQLNKLVVFRHVVHYSGNREIVQSKPFKSFRL